MGPQTSVVFCEVAKVQVAAGSLSREGRGELVSHSVNVIGECGFASYCGQIRRGTQGSGGLCDDSWFSLLPARGCCASPHPEVLWSQVHIVFR